MTSERAVKGPPGPITLAFTGITHLLLGLPVLYTLVLAFSKHNLFAWHPITMALGVLQHSITALLKTPAAFQRVTRLTPLQVALLITEAVFSVSGEAYLGSKLSRQKRITVHWILHTVGLALMFVGLIIVVVNKVVNSRPHFASTHSILGMASIVLATVAAAVGVLTNNTRWLYPRVRPVLLKIFHAFGGIATIVMFIATLIAATYTGWWPENATARGLTITAHVLAGLFILLKPLLGAISRSRVAFAPAANSS